MSYRSLILTALILAHFAMMPLKTVTARAEPAPPAMISGMTGHLTLPSARTLDKGSLRVGLGGTAPNMHSYAGIQITDRFYAGLRQTARSSDLTGDSDALYPGIDLNWQLWRETANRPAASIGLQSAFGHKRMAGEYLVFSKSWHGFDASAGIGWGRFGSGGEIGNPLSVFGDHFNDRRRRDGAMPNDTRHWFTGKEAGLFGGIEYRPDALQELSLIAEWGTDRMLAAAAEGINVPDAPWALGVRLQPEVGLDIRAGLIGGDTIIAGLSWQSQPADWSVRPAPERDTPFFRPYRTGLSLPKEAETAARKDGIALFHTRRKDYKVWSLQQLSPYRPAPEQMRHAATHLANHSGPLPERLVIQPRYAGLKGPAISFSRRSLERAYAHGHGSPQEIWRDAEWHALSPSLYGGPLEQFLRQDTPETPRQDSWRLVLDQEGSLLEEDNGLLYRTSFLAEGRLQTGAKRLMGGALRFNLKHNLDKLADIRPPDPLPVRSDIKDFADLRVGLDRFYHSYLTSLTPSLHVAGSLGYLEEMYSGFGGEILYRPHKSRWTVGADLWQVFKRAPDTALALGLSGDHVMSGHVNAWYDWPGEDVTLSLSAGRYLAEDIGLTLGLDHRARNGSVLSGHLTMTDQADPDLFGGTTHLYGGLKMTIPLGSIPMIPEGSEMRFHAHPLGRNTGQKLDKPLSLYAETNRFSLREISRHWTDGFGRTQGEPRP